MPLVKASSFRPHPLLWNGHLQSILPTLLRRVTGIAYERVRIDTPDGDFLDLDYSRQGSDRIVAVAHGLEGCSRRPYVLGMVRAFNRAGWDAVAWNFRGCSGEPNRRLRSYHSGASEDLAAVVDHILSPGRYRRIALVGFSMGGNIVLKYLGELGGRVDPAIRAAAVFSVPCDLESAAMQMGRPANALYMKRFLRMLHGKIRAKMELFPGRIDDRGYRRIRNFLEFDDRYTAPLCGFENARDYWARASSRPLLPAIRVPTLLVSARDDPFLAGPCYPYREAADHLFLHLEVPTSGGHVGFVASGNSGPYWAESRAVEFVERWAGFQFRA
jgi:predicted alpha/beta-fold hydrolase